MQSCFMGENENSEQTARMCRLCADVQADLRLRRAHALEGSCSHVETQTVVKIHDKLPIHMNGIATLKDTTTCQHAKASALVLKLLLLFHSVKMSCSVGVSLLNMLTVKAKLRLFIPTVR